MVTFNSHVNPIYGARIFIINAKHSVNQALYIATICEFIRNIEEDPDIPMDFKSKFILLQDLFKYN